MSKCGKGCMPECEYFTTGGCISPFNCPYKIETGYINSATSIPTYMGQYNGMSDDDIELCLERLSTCKATDVINFDYAGTLAYLQRLKTENAALRERLDKAVELPCKIGDTIYFLEHYCDYKGRTKKSCSKKERPFMCACEEMIKRACKNERFVINEKPFELKNLSQMGKKYFTSREAAEARLAELKGEKNE